MEEKKEAKEESIPLGAQLISKSTSTNIWDSCTQIYLEQDKTHKKENTAIFVGDKNAGKTSLIQAFLNQYGKKEIKSSAPMEYAFGRKSSLVGSAKELAHLYEIGGGKAFHELMQIPISPERLESTIVVVVLDLSKLNTIMTSLKFWISSIAQQIGTMVPKEKGKAGKLVNEKHSAIWAAHEDKKYLSPIPIPVLVIANKYDTFIKEDPEKKKWLSRALRFICHRKGCSLIMTSISDKGSITAYKNLLSYFLFNSEIPDTADLGYDKALYIPPGLDLMSKIGEPKSLKAGIAGNISAIETLWMETVSEFYPQEEEELGEIEKGPDQIDKFKEDKLDLLIKQKSKPIMKG